jgi:hypothetical protein
VRERVLAFDGARLTSALLLDEEACAYHGQRCANVDVIGLGAHGSSYGLVRAGDHDDRRLALVGPTEQLALTSLHTEGEVQLGNNGHITLAVIGRMLVRLEGAAHRVLDRHVPTGIDAMFVDARGRAWVTAGQRLFRFSRGRGFEPIEAFP